MIVLLPGLHGNRYDIERTHEIAEELEENGFDTRCYDINLARTVDPHDLALRLFEEGEEIQAVVIVASSHRTLKLTQVSVGEVRKVLDRTVVATLNVIRCFTHRFGARKMAYFLLMPEPSGKPVEELAWEIAFGGASRIAGILREATGNRITLCVDDSMDMHMINLMDHLGEWHG